MRTADVRDTMQDVMIGQMSLLHDAFEREFPEYVGKLIPQANGWRYSPEWPSPLRVGRKFFWPEVPSMKARPDTIYEVLLVLRHVSDTIKAIEDKILARARAHGLLHYATAVLTAAVDEAKRDVARARKDVQRLREEEIETPVPYEEISRFLDAKRQEIRRGERKLQLLLVRLYWLQTWKKVEAAKHKKVLREHITQAKSTRFDGLIKPSEILEAYDEIENIYRKHRDNDPYAILGAWYAKTLWQCGASWRELLVVRRRGPSWASVVKRKLRDIGYKQRVDTGEFQ